MSCRVCIQRSLNLAEIICNNLLPLYNRETLVYDFRNVPGTFAQIIEVERKSKDRPARTPNVVFVIASHYRSLQIIVLLLQACLLEIYLLCEI